MKTILVQFAETRWTNKAVEEACVLARSSGAHIIVLRLMPMPHASYLGTDFGYIPASPRDWQRLDEYAATAEDYGVSLTVEPMQCISSLDALLQAADSFGAELVFAPVPRSRIPGWQWFLMWKMQQRLGARFVTLDQTLAQPEEEPLTIALTSHPL